LRSFTVRKLPTSFSALNHEHPQIGCGWTLRDRSTRTERPRVDCEGPLPRDATPKAYSTMSSSKPHADFTQERGRRQAQETSNHYAPDAPASIGQRAGACPAADARSDPRPVWSNSFYCQSGTVSGKLERCPRASIRDPRGSCGGCLICRRATTLGV
jgi:hypothetical protein